MRAGDISREPPESSHRASRRLFQQYSDADMRYRQRSGKQSDEAPVTRRAQGVNSTTAMLETLFEQNYAPLVQMLKLIAGSQTQAEDAVQDAFVQAYRHWSKISGYDDPVAWLRRVAMNRILDQRRRHHREQHALHRLGPAGRVQGSPDSAMDITQAIANLPLRQRAAVVLFYLGDMTSPEVGKTLGIGESTVRSYLHTARNMLAPLLKEYP
jgi:RNA polymerase sigma-70 factor, ECF subfamily